MLSQQDAEAAVGQPLQPPTEQAALGNCTYVSADFKAGVTITLGTLESIKGAATGGSAQPSAVSGVGDEALSLSNPGALLYVRKGDQGFLLVINGASVDGLPDRGLSVETTLAAKVLAKL